jgi:hypothetical protein
MRTLRAVLPVLLATLACRSAPPAADVRSEVRAELDAIAADLEAGGPIAWLPHFVRDGTFWMASEGELKFPSYADAERAVLALAPTVARMQLEWPDPRIDVLAPGLATFAVDYAELLVDTAGEETRFRGHVTGLLVHTDAGWRVRQLHWSMLAPGP